MLDNDARVAATNAVWAGRWNDWVTRTFRRVTTSGRYIPELDGLRFVAIVSVFMVHLAAYLRVKSTTPWIIPWQHDWLWQLASRLGMFGVPLFFIISGFILSLPFAGHRLAGGEPVRLRDYFARRLTRLEPPYLMSLTVFYLSLRILNGLPWELLNHGYLTSFVYLHNLLGRNEDVINAVGWSLEVEVQFYAFAPLLALVFALRNTAVRRLVIVGVAYAAMVLQWFFLDHIHPGTPLSLPDSLPRYIQFFLAGFLLADLYLVEFADRERVRWATWDVLGLAAVPVTLWVIPRDGLNRFLPPALLFLLIAATLRGRVLRWALSQPWVTAVGGMCYSIYLIHYQAISLIGRFTKDLPLSGYFWVNLLFQAVLVGIPTLVLSAIFFVFVEKPCMDKHWPRRLLACMKKRLGYRVAGLRTGPLRSSAT